MGGSGALTMARIEAYYFMNDCFMPKNHIMDNVGVSPSASYNCARAPRCDLPTGHASSSLRMG